MFVYNLPILPFIYNFKIDFLLVKLKGFWQKKSSLPHCVRNKNNTLENSQARQALSDGELQIVWLGNVLLRVLVRQWKAQSPQAEFPRIWEDFHSYLCHPYINSVWNLLKITSKMEVFALTLKSETVELVLYNARSISYNLEAFEVLSYLIQIAGFFLGFAGVLASSGGFGTLIAMVANALAYDIRRQVGK